jgi:hypothetical protein
VLIILVVLLAIGYAARALDGDSTAGSHPAGPRLTAPHWVTTAELAQTAQDGGRLAAKAAMPSCACGLAK